MIGIVVVERSWRDGLSRSNATTVRRPEDATKISEPSEENSIPFVEENFRVIANKDNRAIAGLSMGGGHTTSATNNNPGVFGWIGVFSAGGQDTEDYVNTLKKVNAAGVHHYWIGAGTTDFALEGSEALYAAAQKAGLTASFHTAPGAHFWFIWRQFLGDFGSIIFKQ